MEFKLAKPNYGDQSRRYAAVYGYTEGVNPFLGKKIVVGHSILIIQTRKYEKEKGTSVSNVECCKI